jgi:hypothetical protein
MNLKMGLVILGLCFPSLINRTLVTHGGLFPFFPDVFNFVDNLAFIFLPFINRIIMVVILIIASTIIAQEHKECCLVVWKKSFYVSE